MADKANHQIDDIQILRGVAVLMTIFTHVFWLVTWGPTPILSTLPDYLTFGTGVDLFFVISGYVITRDIMRRFPSSADPLGYWSQASKFWIRRIFRIWPTAWFWLAVILFCTLFFNRSGVFGHFRPNFAAVISAVAQVANLRLWDVDANHSGIAGSFPALDVFWSLSLEEQFYLALPFIMFFFPKRFPKILLIAAVALILTPRHWPDFGWYFRVDPVILGVLLAIWRDSPIYKKLEPKFLEGHAVSQLLFLIGAVMLIASVQPLEVAPISQGLTTIFCAVVVFVSTFDRGYIMPGRIVRSIFLWLGSRSYAIYVVHGIAYFLTREIWFRIGSVATSWGLEYKSVCGWVAALLIISFAEFNFRCIETPLRRKGKQLTEVSQERSATASVSA